MVAPYKNEGPFTLTTGEAVEENRLVKLSASTAVYCDSGEEPIGVTAAPAASGAMVAVEPLRGIILGVTAAKAISAGAAIYAANDGKVSDAAVGTQLGIIFEAATADGGQVPALLWGPRGGSDMLSARGGYVEFWDDCFTYDITNDWAVVEDAGATEADKLLDEANGVVQIGCDGDDNDECYVSSIAEIFKFETDKRLFFEMRVKLTEANTDDANIIIGLSDTVAADSLVDDGAGLMASFDGAVFFKVDGGTVWQFGASNAAAQDINTNAGAFSDGAWTKLGFLYDYNDGVTAIVTPYIDGVAGTPVDLTIAGLEEMHILRGVKAGDINEEALMTDYIHVVYAR